MSFIDVSAGSAAYTNSGNLLPPCTWTGQVPELQYTIKDNAYEVSFNHSFQRST